MKINKKLALFFSIFAAVTFSACSKGEENTAPANNTYSQVETSYILEKLSSKDSIIIDARPESSYIGWTEPSNKRGGHIASAVDFPASWTKNYSDKKLSAVLEEKSIDKDNEIIIYDSNNSDKLLLADKLSSMGFNNIKVYKNTFKDWSEDSSLPVEKLSRYEKLVHPSWLKGLIEGKSVENYSNDSYLVVEVSWGEGDSYKKGHIPGALHLDTGKIEEEPLWNLVSDKDLENVLLSLGIDKDTTVILYGEDTTAAARAASAMMYAGVEDVRLLNGGFHAWKNAGYSLEKGNVSPTPIEDFKVMVPANPQYIISTEKAKDYLADENSELVSIRSWDEYTGKTSGYTYIKPKGRIPGSTWGHAGSDPYHLEDFRNIDNTMKNHEEISTFWKDWGITKDKNTAFYCGTGWRASETFFYAYLMGWDNISVYDGGWYEWSSHKSNPIIIGTPENNK